MTSDIASPLLDLSRYWQIPIPIGHALADLLLIAGLVGASLMTVKGGASPKVRQSLLFSLLAGLFGVGCAIASSWFPHLSGVALAAKVVAGGAALGASLLSGRHREAERGASQQGESTQQKQRVALRALEESETRFRQAFDSSTSPLALLSPSGHWLRANRKLSLLLGHPEEQLVREGYPPLASVIGDLLKEGEGEREMLFTSAGGERVFALTSQWLRGADGKARTLMIVEINDLTRTREAERALREERDTLAAARAEQEGAMAELRQELESARERVREADETIRAYGEQLAVTSGQIEAINREIERLAGRVD